YTGAGRVRSVTGPDGITTTTTYDAAGRVWKLTTPQGDTVHEYDLAGRATRTTSPGGLLTQRSYDDAGRLTTVTDPAGVVTTYTYTDRGERASEAKTGTGTISYTYDADGNLASATDANNHTTTFDYDDRNRRTTQTDPAGEVTTWVYNAAGELTSRIDPLQRATTFTYDAAGRPKVTADPSGRSVTRTYDPAGQLTALTYGDSTSTTFTYDAAGRRASATDASGTTAYAFEPGGQLTKLTRPDGRVTSYTYDTAGRRTKMTLPDGSAFAYTYDTAGRVASITPTATLVDTFTADNGSAPDTAKWTRAVAGNATAAVQDNRLALTLPSTNGAAVTMTAAGATASDGDVVFDYRFGDTTDNATLQAHLRATTNSYWVEVANHTGALTLKKKVGNTTTALASVTAPVDTAWHRLRFRAVGSSIKARVWDVGATEPTTWTLEATDTAITGAGAAKIVFARGKSSHTAFVDDLVYQNLSSPPSPVVVVGYDADNHVTSEALPDGHRTWTWTNGRITALTQTLPGAPQTETLTYDTSGRTKTISTAGVTTTYGYDAASQLVSATPSTGSAVTYGYDNRGRRTTKTVGGIATTYTYDDASQLTAATTGTAPTTYTYDLAGRRLSESGSTPSATYGYDAAGRLATYDTAGTSQTRSYDPSNALVAVANTAAGATTRTAITWDVVGGLPTVAAIAGATTRSILHGPFGPVIARSGTVSTGLAKDALGSVIATPASAPVAVAPTYDTFGVPSTAPSPEVRLGYRGELTSAGLVHLRARSYEPSTAAFTTPDALDGVEGHPTATTRYHYADNDPINRSDPTGLQPGLAPVAEDPVAGVGLVGAGIQAIQRADPWHEAVVEDLIMRAPPFERVPSVYIPGGGLGRSGRGYADVVDILTREIWEVKPFTTYGKRTGRPQLAQYIAAYGGIPGRRYPPSTVMGHDRRTILITFSGRAAATVGGALPIDNGLRYYLPQNALRIQNVLNEVLDLVPAGERRDIQLLAREASANPGPGMSWEFSPEVFLGTAAVGTAVVLAPAAAAAAGAIAGGIAVTTVVAT
ncbi:MAG TPA: RHS repeat-associated core domain-containing protein, partial [Acidimicrobiales bacterium]